MAAWTPRDLDPSLCIFAKDIYMGTCGGREASVRINIGCMNPQLLLSHDLCVHLFTQYCTCNVDSLQHDSGEHIIWAPALV